MGLGCQISETNAKASVYSTRLDSTQTPPNGCTSTAYGVRPTTRPAPERVSSAGDGQQNSERRVVSGTSRFIAEQSELTATVTTRNKETKWKRKRKW